MKITCILMNKQVYSGLSILEICKIVMYELWYDYMKPKYGKKAKLCYMDTARFIAYIVSHQPDINKIYLYHKDLYEAKYQLLINKRDTVDLKP